MRLVLLNDIAAVHKQHPRRNLARKAHLMRDNDHGHAVVGKLLHDLQYLADHFRVECRGRLVKQHDIRVHRERARNGDSLLLTAGKLRRIAVRLVRQTDARIRDLYDELGRQLEPLEKQAKKTEKFLVLRDELRVLEVSLWLEQLERLKSEVEKRSRDAEVCCRQLENAKSEQERRYQQAEQLTADLHGIDRETEALRTSLREAESREAGQASRIAVLRANLENCRANLERVHRENEERAKQAEKLAEQFSAQETRIAELEQSSAEVRERLAASSCRAASARAALRA